jgi:hypothetical protein
MDPMSKGEEIQKQIGKMPKMLWHPLYRKNLIISRLLNLGVLKAIPVFNKLSSMDQASVPPISCPKLKLTSFFVI